MNDQLAAYRREQQARFAASKAARGPGENMSLVTEDNKDLPISSLLADAPPASKRQKRSSDPSSTTSFGATSSGFSSSGMSSSNPHQGQQAGQNVQNFTAIDEIRMKLPPRNVIRLLTWNIDGLDQDHPDIPERFIDGVVEQILELSPTIIFFQEVIPPVLDLLRKFFHPIYHIFDPNPPIMPYFSVIMVLKNSVMTEPQTLGTSVATNSSATSSARGIWPRRGAKNGTFAADDMKRVPFPTTQMGRELLTLQVRYDDIDIFLSTAHLESQKTGTAERKRQLEKSLERLHDSVVKDKCDVGLFGGDLNLRDPEALAGLKKYNGPGASKAGMLPVNDAWVAGGSDTAKKFTWDLQLNDNVAMGGGFVPRCRFDRLYQVGREQGAVQCTRFELVGKKRLQHGRFASDHFGILTEWRVRKNDCTQQAVAAAGSSGANGVTVGGSRAATAKHESSQAQKLGNAGAVAANPVPASVPNHFIELSEATPGDVDGFIDLSD